MTASLRLALQTLLLAIFLHFFGIPAVRKFNRNEVMMVKTSKLTNGIPAPAISVSLPPFGNPYRCFDLTDSVEECIKANTYNQSQTLSDVILGFTRWKSFSGAKNVFTEDYIGTTRQYTFKLNLTIGTDGSQDQLFLVLFPKHVYTIFIFDPKYYLYSTNPVALPTIMTQFDTRTTPSQYYRLDMTEVNELNLPEDPCDAEADTNFHSCIRRSVSDQVSIHQSPTGTPYPTFFRCQNGPEIFLKIKF